MELKFKGQLIEDIRFYKHQKIHKIISLFYCTLIILPTRYTEYFYSDYTPLKVLIVAILIFIAILPLFYFIKYNTKFLKHNSIYIFEDKIEIKDKKNKLIEEISLVEAHQIFINSSFALMPLTFKEEIKAFFGNQQPHFIELKFDNEKVVRRFDFFLESYYMANNLKRIIHFWQLRGKIIEVNQLRKTSQHSVA